MRTSTRGIPIRCWASPHRTIIHICSSSLFCLFLVVAVVAAVVVYLFTIHRQECKYRLLSLSLSVFSVLYALDRYKPSPPSSLVFTTYQQQQHLCIWTEKARQRKMRFFLLSVCVSPLYRPPSPVLLVFCTKQGQRSSRYF